MKSFYCVRTNFDDLASVSLRSIEHRNRIIVEVIFSLHAEITCTLSALTKLQKAILVHSNNAMKRVLSEDAIVAVSDELRRGLLEKLHQLLASSKTRKR